MRWLSFVASYVAIANGELLFEKGVLTDASDISFWGGEGSLSQIVLHGGNQEGSLLLKVVTPLLDVYISPSRGMNIMNMTAKAGGEEMFVGWTSPVKGVVNPAYVNLMERDGSGFLQGFNEAVARCGFQWAGHAGYDAGNLLTLHGLMSNTPVYEVSYNVEEDSIAFYSKTRLATFKKSNFEVTSGIRIARGSREVWLEDTLSNMGDYEEEYMAIYHANFGAPILQDKSKIYVPTKQVSPFNLNAVLDVNEWNTMLKPTPKYDETVYNIFPYANADNWTLALMVNNNEDRAIGVRWRVTELPVFGLWKNLDTEKTGYVVGLEPGTSFSYNRRWNREIGLVPTLPAGEHITFSTSFHPLMSSSEVASFKHEVEQIQGDQELEIREIPLSLQGEGTVIPAGALSYLSLTIGGLLAYCAAFA